MGFDAGSIAGDNIVVIWIDDLIDVTTWRDAFGVRIDTPNIDRFLARGVHFRNAYATVPLCAPCRAELTTGLSPFRTGLVDLNRFWRDVLPPTEAWQFDLRRAGWRTFTTGKTDGNYRPMPEAVRRVLFHEDVPAVGNEGRSRVKVYLEEGPGIRGVNHPDDDGSQDDCFYDWSVAQNAIDYLGRADPGRRHLIQLGFQHPHYNLVCPDRFYQRYDPAAIRWPDIAAPEDFHGPPNGMAVYEAAYIVNGKWTPEGAGAEAWRQVVRGYFAACSHVDHEIGRFLDALEASPLGGTTTVVLLSDNGFNLGNHDSFHKMSQWDSAAHVPLGLWSPRMEAGRAVDLPVSLHNLPKTILALAGLPPRPHWTSGQSLLPLIDPSFGDYDRAQSPVTCVFGTLSVRPSVEGLTHYRYFRYPNGEEHVYDVEADPGETENLAATAPVERLRRELVDGAARLGLDLGGLEDPGLGVHALMAVDGTVALTGGRGDTHYWAYGAEAERIVEEADGGEDTLWYMGGPDDYVLRLPPNVENIRIATVRARHEADQKTGKVIRIVAHPESPIRFEAAERVGVEIVGSRGDDVMIGPKYGGARFEGGAGNDRLVATSTRRKDRHVFHGGPGDDVLIGGAGADYLDGGPGNDRIEGGSGANVIHAGPGNDTIMDGEGGSEIHTGPGRNVVISAGGGDTIHVGPGENEITGGPGATTYVLAYGGLCRITDFAAGDVLDLTAWPAAPVVEAGAEGVVLRLGTSIIELPDAPEAEVRAAIRQAGR
jgi:arylsulfatase A-like enzyme